MKKIGLLLLTFLIPALSLAADIVAPTINVAPSSYYPPEEILYIEGRATPSQDVELLFDKPDHSPIRMVVHVNSNGEWFWGEKFELTDGEWMVKARTLNGKTISDWSNPRIIRAVHSHFDIGFLEIGYLSVIMILLLLFMVGSVFLTYIYVRARYIQYNDRTTVIDKRMAEFRGRLHNRELRLTKDMIEKSFADMRRDLTKELEHLARRSKDGVLTKEEENHRENILRHLKHIEEEVQRQIKDMSQNS